MKKIILLCLAVLMAFTHISAQIVLTKASFPASLIGSDSLKKTTYMSPFPALLPTADAMWDMTSISDTAPVFFADRVAALAVNEYSYSRESKFGSFSYEETIQTSLLGTALQEISTKITRKHYSITSLTSGLTDSLTIDSQLVVYSSPHTIISFPASYNSKWSSSFHADLNIHLSIAAYSYSHAPGIVRRYTTRRDSVCGWGKMRIKDASGVPTGYHKVLQVKTTITTTDSFFVNGLPLSNLALTLLNLTQGATSNTYQENFYRTGEITPLAQVTFADAAYSQPKSAVTHIQRLFVVGLDNLVSADIPQVYPNPVAGNKVFIELPPPAGTSWEYSLTSLSGKTICAGLMQSNNRRYELVIPATISGGIYHLQIRSGGQLLEQRINVIR